MHPVLYKIQLPEFFHGWFPETITIYTYGALIALGAALAAIYTVVQARREMEIPFHISNNLILIILVSAFVGGKLFFFLEDPKFYFGTPANMLRSSANGFVFYGSLIFSIAAVLIFLKVHKIPTMIMLDMIAITTCIVHFFGRLGCFNAGCCYGLPADHIFSVAFTDPVCMARPLNTSLHPTQLYSAFMIATILGVLVLVKKYRKFNGQVFLIYVMLYAIGRGIIEIFRGDYQRGFIIDDYLSHSQLISIILFLTVAFIYYRMNRASHKKA